MMRPRGRIPDAGSFWTHWQLSQLAQGPADFAASLTSASMIGSVQRVAEIVHWDGPLDVVVVWILLDADDLGSALERSQHHLFGLIDSAGLQQPGRVDLLAGRHNRLWDTADDEEDDDDDDDDGDYW